MPGKLIDVEPSQEALDFLEQHGAWVGLSRIAGVARLLDAFVSKSRQERDITESAFCELHRKAQTLAYEVSVRPQDGDDWEPVRRAIDELATELVENMPVEASREGPAR